MRKMILLTEGFSNPHTAKTACSVIRYRREEVVGVLDSTQKGKLVSEFLQVGDELRFISNIDEVPAANTLLIGIAPPGGKIPPAWRVIIRQAIDRKMNIVSGLHDFISDDEEFATAAKVTGSEIYDVRKNSEKTIARCKGIDERCLRIHAVGHDCSIGKMVTSIEVTNRLKQLGRKAKFIATGQTGIMIEGDGLPIDCVVADFVAGAAEKLVLQNQHHEILLIEGQGSLTHPSYSGVTLGLLHGCAPHGLFLCYEVGREVVTGVEHIKIPPLSEVKRIAEIMSNARHPCKIIGISMNSRRVTAEQAEIERERVEREFQLPVVDVFRHGPDRLVQAVLKLEQETAAARGV